MRVRLVEGALHLQIVVAPLKLPHDRIPRQCRTTRRYSPIGRVYFSRSARPKIARDIEKVLQSLLQEFHVRRWFKETGNGYLTRKRARSFNCSVSSGPHLTGIKLRIPIGASNRAPLKYDGHGEFPKGGENVETENLPRKR